MRGKTLHPAARMTVAAYARHRKVSRRAVYDALHAGRIARCPDGTIDAKVADRAWTVNTLPHVGGKRRAKAKGRTPVSAEGVAAGETEARTLLRKGAADVLSFADARRARELVRLAREAFELRKMQADTFSKAEVDRYVYPRSRSGGKGKDDTSFCGSTASAWSRRTCGSSAS